MKKKILKPSVLVPIAVMAVLISASGIIFHQNFLRMTPLYISLFVMVLSAQVSRYSYLLGGLNSIIYAVIYLYYGLYAVAAQAFFFSFPMQIITFFRWKKHSEKDNVKFKRMNVCQIVLCIVAYCVAWIGAFFLLKKAGSVYAVLDNTSSLLGIFISVITVFAYIEYTYMMIPSGIINILLNIQVVLNTPEQMPFLIFSVYSLICVSFHFVNARKIYKSQNE